MRALAVSMGAYGHFHPMVPLARCLVADGHEVLVATTPNFCEQVEKSGFSAAPVGITGDEARKETAKKFPLPEGIPEGERRRLLAPKSFREVHAPAMAKDLVPLCEQWNPDVVVCEESVFAAPVVAKLAGTPLACVGWGSPLAPPRLVESPPLWSEWGLDPVPGAGLFEYLFLDQCPPSLQNAEIAEIQCAHSIRTIAYDGVEDDAPPDWMAELGEGPIAYLTMGTISNLGVDDLFRAVIEATSDLVSDLIVSVGPNGDPAALGSQPNHVRLERYVPQTKLLPLCDLVVSHAGAGTTLAALQFGVPQLLLPQHGHSQERTAAAVERVGAARVLRPGEADRSSLAQAAGATLNDQGFREAAARVSAEIASLPGPEFAAELIAALAERKLPISRRDR